MASSVRNSFPTNTRNMLYHVYSNNPYPDRFQIGVLARQSNISGKRVKTWFANRRAYDCRKGKLCRQCRFFKSSQVSDELHQTDPYTRHCVLASLYNNNQEQLEAYARQFQNFINRRSASSENSSVADNTCSNNSQIEPSTLPPVFNHIYQESSFQLDWQQQTMLYPTLKDENENQENVNSYCTNDFRFTSNTENEFNAPCGRQITCPPVMNSRTIGPNTFSHSWMMHNVTFPVLSTSQQPNLGIQDIQLGQQSTLLTNDQFYDEGCYAQQTFHGHSNNEYRNLALNETDF